MKEKRGIVRHLKVQIGWLKPVVIFCLLLVLNPLSAAEELQTVDAALDGKVPESSSEDASQFILDKDVESARERIKADPSSVREHVNLGYLLLKSGSNNEAEKAFDDALALNPRYNDALTGKGIVLARMGQDQAAEEFLQKALILNPNPVRTHFELGMLYEKKGDFQKAITEYKNGIEKFRQGRK